MGIRNILEDSETYQEILSEGEARGIRKGEAKGLREGEAKARKEALVQTKARSRELLLKQGTLRFGPPDMLTHTAIQSIDELDHLDRMTVAVVVVSSWAEVIATP